ncbi:hypothetical protein ACFL5K_01580 [Gemmatimonadota bacterium]
MSKRKKFVLNCEFELFGDNSSNVVTTCQQLNIHTEDDSIQGAMKKLTEAVVFFFDTAENRNELEAVVSQLAGDKAAGS